MAGTLELHLAATFASFLGTLRHVYQGCEVDRVVPRESFSILVSLPDKRERERKAWTREQREEDSYMKSTWSICCSKLRSKGTQWLLVIKGALGKATCVLFFRGGRD